MGGACAATVPPTVKIKKPGKNCAFGGEPILEGFAGVFTIYNPDGKSIEYTCEFHTGAYAGKLAGENPFGFEMVKGKVTLYPPNILLFFNRLRSLLT